jgi:hypothetical protein
MDWEVLCLVIASTVIAGNTIVIYVIFDMLHASEFVETLIFFLIIVQNTSQKTSVKKTCG